MRVTEKKKVKIDRGCKPSPFFVTWLNHLGGRDQWLFFKRQDYNVTTSEVSTFEPSIPDLELARGNIVDQEIFSQPSVIVYGYVDNEDMRGLMSIVESVNVEWLVNPDTWQTEGVKWQTIRPRKGTFAILSTDEKRSQVQITFDLPHRNIQAQ